MKTLIVTPPPATPSPDKNKTATKLRAAAALLAIAAFFAPTSPAYADEEPVAPKLAAARANPNMVVCQDTGIGYRRSHCVAIDAEGNEHAAGSVVVDKATGQVRLFLRLETDSITHGVSGSFDYQVLDAANRVLFAGTSPSPHINPKSGHYRWQEYEWAASMPVPVAAQAARVTLQMRASETPWSVPGTDGQIGVSQLTDLGKLILSSSK